MDPYSSEDEFKILNITQPLAAVKKPSRNKSQRDRPDTTV